MKPVPPAHAPAQPSEAPRRARLAISALMLGLGCACGVRLWLSGETPAVAPADATLRLDPNRATCQELALLPGLGPKLSQRIVKYRCDSPRTPAFDSPADLANVRGIGPATIAKLRPHLRFAPPMADGAGAPP